MRRLGLAVDDVVIAGAGPAGAFAAWLLARRGARVTVVERCRFPRPKLCGDTINPGALALLGHFLPVDELMALGWPLDGMVLTGPGNARIHGHYGNGLRGLGVTREKLDAWLMERAVAAGARFRDETTVVGPLIGAGDAVTGVMVRTRAGIESLPARMTLAADGRQSRLARHVGGARLASRPRRWAIGQYFEDVDGLTGAGEMHVREGGYIGVAPTGDGLANVCLVAPPETDRADWAAPARMLTTRLSNDPWLASRFARARAVGRPHVLGPLAIETSHPGGPGLLLAGDAAGFIDPMTGDGVHLALQGAEEAGRVVAAVLDGELTSAEAHHVYARALHRRVTRKRQFDWMLREFVSSPGAIRTAAAAARIWPAPLQVLIRYAGDTYGISRRTVARP